MKIAVNDLGKRYRQSWVFRGLDLELHQGERWALTGPNGSGKSTLVRILAGSLRPSHGEIRWENRGEPISPERVFQEVSLAAPYLELIEPFTLCELLDFHQKLKPWRDGMNANAVIERCGLQRHADKAIRDFSSGMRQRVRLATALFSQTGLLLLDEPTTNLDEAGKGWFDETLESCSEGRLVVIASNQASEIRTCTRFLDLVQTVRPGTGFP